MSDAAVQTDAHAELLGPADPTTIALSFATGPCFGDCPVFNVSADQSGAVTYMGESCVASFGARSRSVQASQVRAIYEKIREIGFFGFHDHYTSAADGCEVWTDASTESFGVKADDTEKQVDHYFGCMGDFPEFAALAELRTALRALVEADVGTPLFNCGNSYPYTFMPAPSYRLLRGEDPQGTLVLSDETAGARTFRVLSCTGDELAAGSARPEGTGYVLSVASDTFAWPGIEGPVASVLLVSGEDTLPSVDSAPVHLQVTVQQNDATTTLRAEQAGSCTP